MINLAVKGLTDCQFPDCTDANSKTGQAAFNDNGIGSKDFQTIFLGLLDGSGPEKNKKAADSDKNNTEMSFFEARAQRVKDSLELAQQEAKIKAAVKRIAGFLGVSEGFLKMVLESLGIEPEDLINKEKIGVVIRKLSEYFGFDEKKKKEFEVFVNKTLETINAGYF